MNNEKGDWLEYRMLILKELQELNNHTKSHKDILIDIDKTLIRHSESLDEHIKRTDIAEKRIEMLTAQINPLLKVTWLYEVSLKFLVALAAIIGVIIAIVEYVTK